MIWVVVHTINHKIALVMKSIDQKASSHILLPQGSSWRIKRAPLLEGCIAHVGHVTPALLEALLYCVRLLSFPFFLCLLITADILDTAF